MRVRDFVARTAVRGTAYGRPENLDRLLKTPVAPRAQSAPLRDMAKEFDDMARGLGRDGRFDVQPSLTRLDAVLVTQEAAAPNQLVRLTDESSRALIDLVEGFSTAIRDAARKDSRIRTNDPNPHELEESIVDGLLLAVQGTQPVWNWTTMRAKLEQSVADQLLRDKGEADFPGSVFVEADRTYLRPFLNGVKINHRSIFDSLEAWYDSYVQPLTFEAVAPRHHAAASDPGQVAPSPAVKSKT